jgi:hypothetical protein
MIILIILQEKKIIRKIKKVIGIVDVEGFCDEEINLLFKKTIEEISKKTDFKIKIVKLPLDIFMKLIIS